MTTINEDDPNIEGDSGNNNLAPMGDATRYDYGVGEFSQPVTINGYEGRDKISGGAGVDYLDGGEENDVRDDGRDYNEDGNLVVDSVYYIDADNGIVADFDSGVVSNDGFGSTDYVSNFERVYGSYHDDSVVLSHDIYRGYTPLYGNDSISGPSTYDPINMSYVGYWNLENASSGYEQTADGDVTDAHIVVNFDNRTIDKYITGGDFDINTDPDQADYTDTLTAGTYVEGVVGSRGDDIMYGMSDGMQSVVIDGQREWTYGWLQGYYGDDTILMSGSGDDHARGGYGDDLLISTGTGLNKLEGQSQSHNDYPNYGVITDFDTFAIGGYTNSHTIISDYEVGESVVILDQGNLAATDFERVYDFGSDTTTFSVVERLEALDTVVYPAQDFLTLKGNFEISDIQNISFTSDRIADVDYGNASTTDSQIQFSASTDVPFETIVGGQSSDTIVAEGGSEYIRTGGGSDSVYAGAGADVVVVQGQGDVVVDTGTRTDPVSGETVSDGDADTVQVESTFSGTLLIKNTGAGDRIEINKEISGSSVDNENDLKITFDNDNEIVIEDYYTVDQDGFYTNNGSLIKIDGWHNWHGGFPDADVYWSVGTGNADRLYSSILPGQAEEGIITTLSGRGGNDELFVGEGVNQIFGGEGVDKFFLESGQQHTSIIGDIARVGDEYISPPIVTDGGMPDFSTTGTDFGDSVYLGWLESEVELKELYGPGGNNYFRITTNDGQSVVDLYDVEKLYFSDYVDEQDFKALTNGRVIGKDDWFGAANGVDIDYHQANVSFEIDGSIIKVKASGSAVVTEEMFETNVIWDFVTVQYNSMDYPTITEADWISYGGTKFAEEQIPRGVQTYEKVFEDEVIWEGERTEVDYFNFAGEVDVNVVNVSPENTAGDPIFGAPGTTEGIDLVFGTKDADFIDGRGGDDIIFGGGGDDVIIGGDGDDVIIGGDGSDILRGDRVDSNDAALAAWQAGIAEFNAENPNNTVTFDENMLSMDNSGTNAGDGNDVIVGGDGLDDIKSGDGENFVTSGKADIDGDGQANLDLINQNIENHQHLLDDEDWV
jgi:hypothetical protein